MLIVHVKSRVYDVWFASDYTYLEFTLKLYLINFILYAISLDSKKQKRKALKKI